MRKLLFLIIMTVLCPSFYSCSNEDDEEVAEAYYHDMELRHLLYGEYVMFTKVTVNSVDKTLLEGGCPTRVVFDWVGDSLVFSIPEMQIGNMPFPISFKANCVITSLNSWEADEHAGGNTSWFKFVGDKTGYVSTGNGPEPNGSSITGFFNPATSIIEFVIDYNVMNVRTVCDRQVLDINKTRDYDTEMAKYMAALAEIKNDNGLDKDAPIYDNDEGDYDDGNGPAVSLEVVSGTLVDDIVLNSNVTVNGNLMAQSCPTLTTFSWSGKTMTLNINDLQVGKMPFAISFSCSCSNVNLSAEDLTSYSPAWYKFEGKGGVVTSNPSMVNGSDGTVVCFYNPASNRIAMIIDFNVMGTIVDFPIQTIDFDRADNYAAELDKYQSNSSSK